MVQIIKEIRKHTKHIYGYGGFTICLFPYNPYKQGEKNFYIDSYYFISNKIYHLFKKLGIEQYNGDLKKLIVDAGIGTIGKNSLVYVDGLGSFFYIAVFRGGDNTLIKIPEIVCSNCNKCVMACPQQCIEPNTIKVNCIRALAGTGKVKQLGCNVCQIVCPMNSIIKVKKTPRRYRVDPNKIDYKKLEKQIGSNLAKRKYFE